MTQASLLPTSVQSAHLPHVQSYNSPVFGAIRTFEKEGQPWFVATDICSALKYTNSSKAIADHVDSEDRYNEPLERGGTVIVINESGLYSLILRSRKSEAKKFKRWVTSEVLPSIRRSGSYAAPTALTASTTVSRKPLTSIVKVWSSQTGQKFSQCYSQINAYFNLEGVAELPVEWIPDAIAFVQTRIDAHALAIEASKPDFEPSEAFLIEYEKQVTADYQEQALEGHKGGEQDGLLRENYYLWRRTNLLEKLVALYERSNPKEPWNLPN